MQVELSKDEIHCLICWLETFVMEGDPKGRDPSPIYQLIDKLKGIKEEV